MGDKCCPDLLTKKGQEIFRKTSLVSISPVTFRFHRVFISGRSIRMFAKKD